MDIDDLELIVCISYIKAELLSFAIMVDLDEISGCHFFYNKIKLCFWILSIG